MEIKLCQCFSCGVIPATNDFNDSAQLYFAAGVYCLHVKLTVV